MGAMEKKDKSAREVALDVINRVNQSGSYANLLLSEVLGKSALSRRDKALVTELVYGTLRAQGSIDWILTQCSSRDLDKIPPRVLDILRLGCYQLVFLTKIPPRAACFESVELAKKDSHRGIASFVNGVLRTVSRKHKELPWPNFKEDPLDFISLKLSHPLWLVEMWVEDFGLEETKNLCQANNLYPPMAVRTNTLKTSRDELCRLLEKQGLEVSKSSIVEEGLVVEKAGDLSKLDLFKEGYFFIQDESSMLVSHVVSPQEGEAVLDCCAAPGGKATHLAQLMQDKGRIVAVDIHPERLNLIKQNSTRLGIKIVETLKADATKLDRFPAGSFDKVLVDAPCTGLGVLARRPDARWKKSLAQIEELSILQSRILKSVAPLLKKGGALVYSVCTISHQEGIEVVEGFLQSHSEFKLDDTVPYLPKLLRQGEPYWWVQLLPQKHRTDGMFIARMIKR